MTMLYLQALVLGLSLFALGAILRPAIDELRWVLRKRRNGLIVRRWKQ